LKSRIQTVVLRLKYQKERKITLIAEHCPLPDKLKLGEVEKERTEG
jgi:hypothetical protein